MLRYVYVCMYVCMYVYHHAHIGGEGGSVIIIIIMESSGGDIITSQVRPHQTPGMYVGVCLYVGEFMDVEMISSGMYVRMYVCMYVGDHLMSIAVFAGFQVCRQDPRILR